MHENAWGRENAHECNTTRMQIIQNACTCNGMQQPRMQRILNAGQCKIMQYVECTVNALRNMYCECTNFCECIATYMHQMHHKCKKKNDFAFTNAHGTSQKLHNVDICNEMMLGKNHTHCGQKQHDIRSVTGRFLWLCDGAGSSDGCR